MWRSAGRLRPGSWGRCQAAAAAEAPPKADKKQKQQQQGGSKAAAEATITKKSEDYSRRVWLFSVLLLVPALWLSRIGSQVVP